MKSAWNNYIVWITIALFLQNETSGSPDSLSADDMVVCVSHHQHGGVVGTGGARCLLQSIVESSRVKEIYGRVM